MKHFLWYIEDAIRNNWDKPAISNYGATTYTYGEIAGNVAKLHILFEKCGLKKGDHIAIASRPTAPPTSSFPSLRKGRSTSGILT